MKSVLLLYASTEGQTEKIALVIADHLRHEQVKTVLVNAEDSANLNALVLADFDMLVFGASLHVGKIDKTIQTFINAHAQEIAAKPRAFFLVSLSAAEKEVEKREAWLEDARRKLQACLDVSFNDIEMIAGALKYSAYSWPVRFMMKRIAGKAGGDTDTSKDYEYTDWIQVAGLCRRIESSL